MISVYLLLDLRGTPSRNGRAEACPFCLAAAPVFLAVGLFLLTFARHPALCGQDGSAL